MYKLKSIKETSVNKKKVFLRADLDVPIASGKIKDDTRLKAWFPTLEYLLTNQATVYIAGHLGRPDGFDSKLNLKPIADWIRNQLEIHLDLKEVEENGFRGWDTNGNVIILDNLRFYKEEEKNDQEFSQKLASLAEIYVNDAFASSHRAHSSIVGITKYLPSFAGLRLEKEVTELSKILETPKRPLVVIIGGAKIETKLPLVSKMHAFADYVLVGGEIAENDKVLLSVQHEKLEDKKSILLVAELTEDLGDITLKSAENFVQIIQNANTIVWNGPMGKTEDEKYQQATEILANAISKSTAYSIVGGGDTLAFLKEKNLLDKFSFASTGGGAMLEFLAGDKLPGIQALVK